MGISLDIGTVFILESEALALKETIYGVIALHLDNVVFESDS